MHIPSSSVSFPFQLSLLDMYVVGLPWQWFRRWRYFGSSEMRQHLGQHLLCLPSKLCLLRSMYRGCGPRGLWTRTDKRKGLYSWASSRGIACCMEKKGVAVASLHSRRSMLVQPRKIGATYFWNPHSVCVLRLVPGAWCFVLLRSVFYFFGSLLLQEVLDHRTLSAGAPWVRGGEWRNWERRVVCGVQGLLIT